jgi:hypothetical protein
LFARAIKRTVCLITGSVDPVGAFNEFCAQSIAALSMVHMAFVNE